MAKLYLYLFNRSTHNQSVRIAKHAPLATATLVVPVDDLPGRLMPNSHRRSIRGVSPEEKEGYVKSDQTCPMR